MNSEIALEIKYLGQYMQYNLNTIIIFLFQNKKRFKTLTTLTGISSLLNTILQNYYFNISQANNHPWLDNLSSCLFVNCCIVLFSFVSRSTVDEKWKQVVLGCGSLIYEKYFQCLIISDYQKILYDHRTGLHYFKEHCSLLMKMESR